jgi:hypothetical protein
MLKFWKSVKILLNWGIVAAVCLLMAVRTSAAITNASWIFPTTTTPAPSQPVAANLSIYSTNNLLGWTLFNSSLNVAFVSNPGNTTALEFSYNGNHAAYLNGSTLTLTNTVSGLAAGTWLDDIQISYDTRWNKIASTVTESWAYSINGAAYINFDAVAVTGNTWQTEIIQLSGVTLYNGDTLTLRNTFSGAAGNNGALDFDNFEMTSNIVPEPPAMVLVVLSLGVAGLWFNLRCRTRHPNSRPAPATVRTVASK